MLNIDFSYNWNGKLFLDNFGSVRLHNPEKYFIGHQLEVSLKSVHMGKVEVAAVRTFRFKDISDTLAFIDCGKPAAYLAGLLRRMYANKIVFIPETRLDHVTFHYLTRHLDNHATQLQAWWKDTCQTQQNKFLTQRSIF